MGVLPQCNFATGKYIIMSSPCGQYTRGNYPYFDPRIKLNYHPWNNGNVTHPEDF